MLMAIKDNNETKTLLVEYNAIKKAKAKYKAYSMINNLTLNTSKNTAIIKPKLNNVGNQ